MTLLKNIPTPLLWSLGILTLGVGIIAFTLLMTAMYGFGVPYHDGPYAGYSTKPGFGRWYESHLLIPSITVGSLLILFGLPATILYITLAANRASTTESAPR